MERDSRERILARRARFVAASLATLGATSCDPPPARDPSTSSTDAGAPDAMIVGGDEDATVAPPPPPPDRDHDGTPDSKDQCPDVGGPPQNKGCPTFPMPCLSVAMPVARIELHQRIYFEANKATIKSTSMPLLSEIATVLKDNPQIVVEIGGHLDATEKPPLDFARAQAVKDVLVKNGVADARLSIKGFADKFPADTNATEGGKENNRRVEFTRTDNASP
jgi:outer membrane protein OmpA-like peptidoglycan-associated protein